MRAAKVSFITIQTLTLDAGCGDPMRDPLATGEARAVIDPAGQSVDGLIVGHRLMEAGEYELALRAYYRAASDQGMTADVLSAIGSANLRLGRLGQAEQGLRQAIELDERFAAAWNNLGVVLMERGDFGQARRVFETAFALDGGKSPPLRENLRLAIQMMENNVYHEDINNDAFELVRRGGGRYELLQTP
jgi:Flp pilus assembly protein TadD